MTQAGGPPGPLGRLRAVLGRSRARRRIRFTPAGAVFVAGTLAVGFVAVTTGNNLLHLLLGALLGALGVSGWAAEQSLRGLRVVRRIPRGVPVGQEAVLRYTVHNGKRRLATLGLEIREAGLPGVGYVPRISAGGAAEARAGSTFVRRGVHALGPVTLTTAFPLGLFRRDRIVPVPGELVIWPRTDRPVPPPRAGAGRRIAAGADRSRAPGPRGEFRGLRDYRWGDDARDIHWRSSARRRTPVLREYDRDASETLWVCLDLASAPGDAAEEAVEIAAALSARASAEGRRHGLVAGSAVVEPGTGRGHLERVLEVLARADFEEGAPPPSPPVDPTACVLVTAGFRGGTWADVRRPATPVGGGAP